MNVDRANAIAEILFKKDNPVAAKFFWILAESVEPPIKQLIDLADDNRLAIKTTASLVVAGFAVMPEKIKQWIEELSLCIFKRHSTINPTTRTGMGLIVGICEGAAWIEENKVEEGQLYAEEFIGFLRTVITKETRTFDDGDTPLTFIEELYRACGDIERKKINGQLSGPIKGFVKNWLSSQERQYAMANTLADIKRGIDAIGGFTRLAQFQQFLLGQLIAAYLLKLPPWEMLRAALLHNGFSRGLVA